MSNELQMIVSAGAIDRADPEAAAVMVTAALRECQSWLAVAMTGTDPMPIAEFKAWARTVEEATKQKRLGEEIELDAAEMVRRAERGLGMAVRNGQAAGKIRARGQSNGNQYTAANGVRPVETNSTSSPRDFLGPSGGTSADSYAMTDDVTDEQFDQAIADARAEGNLTRVNVVRKIRGETRRQPDSCAFDPIEMALGNLKTAHKVLLASRRTKENADDYREIKRVTERFVQALSKIGKDYHNE